MKFSLQLFMFFILSTLLSTEIFAQAGKIAGRIIDANSKEPIIGANVVLMGTTQGAATDLEGNYVILDVAPEIYTIKVSAIGYRTELLKNVSVSIDLTTRVDFDLKETTIEIKAIVVTAKRPLIQKDLTSSIAIITAQEIKSLPVTSFQNILQLQAGVVDGHFRGGRSGEVSYLIDGIPVTDAYNGGTVVDVNKNSIQEMQVVTGTFNAEYGQAMSGIVNIATKSGGNQTHGSITAYEGAYLTQHNTTFNGLERINPFSNSTANKIHWLEGTINGPIIPGKLTYFIDLRYYYTSGYLMGIRKFNTWDIANTLNPNSYKWKIQQTGDRAIVPMAPYLEGYAQGKITYRFSPSFRISYNYILDNTRGKDWDFAYKYNPDGILSNFKKGYLNSLKITNILSSKTYFTLGFSYFFKDERHYLDTTAFSLSDLFQRNDPFNQKYVNTRLLTQPERTFFTGGTNMYHGVRNTNTYVAKFDLTSQVTTHHEIKTGLLFEYYTLFLHDINLHMSQIDYNNDPVVTGDPFLIKPVVIPSIETQDNQRYVHNPWRFSFYAQDKMEYKSLIVNFGVRFDYFHPNGQVLADPSDPNVYLPIRPQYQDSVIAPGGTHQEAVAKRKKFWYKNASNKWQLSPRLGISFPITDRGIIHFSYGLFFQIPSFERLYSNPGYKLAVAGGSTNLGIVGNPNLKPEQTTSGELGLQQQLTESLALDITAYFRDIRNLAGTLNEIEYVFGGTKVYSKYVNSDFGFVRGIVLSLKKRFKGGVSANLNYTFQIAKTNASDPNASYNLRSSGVQAETQLIPTNWDQRHTVNITFSYVNSASNWGVSGIFRYGSGTPYTPLSIVNVGTLIYNSQTKPSTYRLDVQFFKDFKIAASTLSVFLRNNNLLDTKNVTQVYPSFGQPNWSIGEQRQLEIQQPEVISTIRQRYIRPDYYSEPRRVELGTTISF